MAIQKLRAALGAAAQEQESEADAGIWIVRKDVVRIRQAAEDLAVQLLELDGVKLEFDKDALLEIAETTLKRKTGARGLRAIMENIMMDTMFTVPSDKTIKECRITKEAVLGLEEPKYTRDSEDRKSFLTSESK